MNMHGMLSCVFESSVCMSHICTIQVVSDLYHTYNNFRDLALVHIFSM